MQHANGAKKQRRIPSLSNPFNWRTSFLKNYCVWILGRRADPALTSGLCQTSDTELFTQGANWMRCYKHVYSILVNSWRNHVCGNLILSLLGKQSKCLSPYYGAKLPNNVPGESDQCSLSRPAMGVATDLTIFDSKHCFAAPITSCSQPVILKWRIFSPIFLHIFTNYKRIVRHVPYRLITWKHTCQKTWKVRGAFAAALAGGSVP